MEYLISKLLISSQGTHLDLVHLQLHSEVTHPWTVSVRLAVVAIRALTFKTAWNSSPVALTIVLLAGRFLASAFSTWHEGWHSWEMTRISMIGNFLSMVNSSLVSSMVATARTDTSFSTFFALSKALTVKLEAVDF